ncbi:DNA repair protein complementing XP-G cells homolog [Thalassophryne amazonica]|uniref:DNA repair protein complementing XP-G cells homolog n=1 Tax=Thalassophryne amazonica TaxID=390379 RepID=UPI001470A435|nr:DNA repair protein complementing XP-G cells homolog [Thalassophryne amazonica]
MGVQGLWRLLESTGKPINPETLEGKILAVDISIWLNQAVKGLRDREGNSVHNAHLLTLFHRICKLLFFRIRPVFVFDGDAPLLKRQTLALRRQRKEELSLESKQTKEKLLKTFLKRQAIKAALGDRSKDPLPSLSSVRRNEVDEMYVLPALPPAEEEEDRSSSEKEEKDEMEEMVDYPAYQEGFCEDPKSVNINSEEFASLPAEIKHDILKDMKEFSKRRRTMYYKPPEHSGDFSQYQLAGLLQRNQLNLCLEGVEKEMCQRSSGSAPQLCQGDTDQQSIESHRLVSEDFSHYILIKGSTKSDTVTESQPAAALWTGSSFSGFKRRGVDRGEPLWRPAGQEEEETSGPSLEEMKPAVSKPAVSSQGDTSPPSPRTLRAIQSAMNDSSDEESQSGSVSPRTLLAIQQALEGDGAAESKTLNSVSTTEAQVHFQHHVPPVVISIIDEEAELENVPKFLNYKPNINLNCEGKQRGQNAFVTCDLFVSGSEDEMEDVIGQRNRALQQQFDREKEAESNKESEVKSEDQTSTDRRRQPEQQGEPEKNESDHGQMTLSLSHKNDQLRKTVAADKNTLSVNLSAQLSGNPFSVAECPFLQEQKQQHTPVLEDKVGDGVNSKGSEESDSEESFVEVSEEEFKEEDADDSPTKSRQSPEDVHENGTKSEEKPEDSLTEDINKQTEEKDVKEGTQTDSSLTPATNEWEHFDLEELETLKNSLQAEQSSLREQQQHQERMANTVTGQMCLESQELLRLFGVPFLVAPMEAEAQCAVLDRADQTHGTITDDSDVWLFGGRHVYKNFFSQNKYVEHYQFSDLQSQLGLDRTKLINLAYLLGSDYTEGIPGVGHVTGMEILNEFPGPGLEPLRQLSKWWSEAQDKKRLVSDPRDSKVKRKLRGLKLPPGFPNTAVAQAYLQPAVDQSDSSFSWGRPQFDLIKEFCQSRFGWNARKTEETLQPVMKQLNVQQTQLQLDSFFRMEQQEKQKIRSQRLRRAVTCLKRKEREGAEEEDTEEEIPSPSKSKKPIMKSQERGSGGLGEGPVIGGGFLGSGAMEEPALTSLKDVSCSRQCSEPGASQRQSSSTSGDDSDGSSNVPMVTARSVFEGGQQGRSTKSMRGRGRGKRKKE